MKIKSLAAEAGFIRHEERKAETGHDRSILHQHRTWDVRREQRASLLAYGFLRGLSYRAMEPAARASPDLRRVARLIEKFGGGRMTPDVVHEWCSVAPTAERPE